MAELQRERPAVEAEAEQQARVAGGAGNVGVSCRPPAAATVALTVDQRLERLRQSELRRVAPLDPRHGTAPAASNVVMAPNVQPADPETAAAPRRDSGPARPAFAPSVDADAWARTIAAQRASAPPLTALHAAVAPPAEETAGMLSTWGSGWMTSASALVAPPVVMEPEPEPEPELQQQPETDNTWCDHLGATVLVASAPPPVESAACDVASAPPLLVAEPQHAEAQQHLPPVQTAAGSEDNLCEVNLTRERSADALAREWGQLRGTCVKQHVMLREELAESLLPGADRVATRAVDASGELYSHLKAYYDAARRCDVDRQQAVAEADACDAESGTVWDISQGEMPMESTCSCGSKVRTTVLFPTAKFDPLRAEQLSTRLEGLRRIWFDQLARSMFDSRLCEHSVAVCVQRILCKVQVGATREQADDMKTFCTDALSTLFYFESSLGHEAVEGTEVPRFRGRVRDWIAQVSVRLSEFASTGELCELLRHMIVNGSGDWGTPLLQLPPANRWGANSVRAFMRLLVELLFAAVGKEAAEEVTYIQLFEQLPWTAFFDHVFSDPMRPPLTPAGSARWYDGEQSTATLPEPLRVALRTLTLVEHLVETLSIPLSQFSNDHLDLARTVAHTLTVVIRKVEYYCESYGPRLDIIADQTAGTSRAQLRTTVDCLYARTVACLLCSKNESVWAEGDTLQFRRLSGSGAWAIVGYVFSRRADQPFSADSARDERTYMAAGFTQPADTVLEWSERLQRVPSFRSEFAEFVSELGDRGAYYLLSLLANIAVAAAGPYAKRSFPDENDGFILSQAVLMELFHVGYVEASTRESLFRVVQKLLPDIVAAAPQLLSLMLNLAFEKARYIGNAVKDLFHAMPLDQWVPSEDDFDTVKKLMCEPEQSIQHAFGRQLCESLCWDCRQGTRSAAPQLAIPPTSHRKFALVVLEALLHHEKRAAVAQQAAGILDRVYGIDYSTESFGRWSWDRLLDLSLQQPCDQTPWPELQPIPSLQEDPRLQSVRELVRMNHPIAVFAAFELTTVGYDLAVFRKFGLKLLHDLFEGVAGQHTSGQPSWLVLKSQVACGLMRVVIPRLLTKSPEKLAPFSPVLGAMLGVCADQSMTSQIMSLFGSEPDAAVVSALHAAAIGTSLRWTSTDENVVHDGAAATSVQLAWMHQFLGVSSWRSNAHVKGLIGSIVKTSLVAGDLPALILAIQQSSGAETFKRQAAGAYDSYAVPQLSSEVASGSRNAEYTTFALLLAHTATEAGNRQVLGSQLAQLWGEQRTLQAAADRMQLSKTRIVSLSNFAIHSWCAAVLQLDPTHPILPLYYQVLLCLFFQTFKDARSETLFMGHRFLSGNTISKLQTKLDADATTAFAAGNQQAGTFFNSARDWMSRGTTDVGSASLFEDQRYSSTELAGMRVEQPWDKPALLWTHLINLSELRASLSDVAWQPKLPSLPAEPPPAVKSTLDPVPMFCRPQPVSDLSMEPSVVSPWPLHNPLQLQDEVSDAVASVQQSYAQYQKHREEIVALDVDIEGLLPQLYENRQVEKVQRQECSKLQRPWSNCKGAARFAVKSNAVRKVDFMWKQLGGNRERWRNALNSFDVDMACVRSVARVRETFEHSRRVPVVTTTNARDAARGTDIVLNSLLPGLLQNSKPSIADFAAAQAMLTFSLSLCASAYIRSSVFEMERVLVSILENPHFIPHVVDHFDPFVYIGLSEATGIEGHLSCFVSMYARTIQAMNSRGVHPGLIMMLVQKFDLNEWLCSDPGAEACALMITTCAEGLEQLHATHGPQDLLWGNGTLDLNTAGVMEHVYHVLRKTAQFQWPAQFEVLLDELLIGRLASVAPTLAEPSGLPFSELPSFTIEAAVAKCAASFDVSHGTAKLYEDTQAVQRLQSSTSWVRAMLASPQAREEGEWCWRMAWEMYQPWLTLGPQDDWLWDVGSEASRASAAVVLDDFASFVLQLCGSLPKLSLLSCWEWLHSLLSSGDPSSPPLPARGIGLVCASLGGLPWELLPSRNVQENMLKDALQTLESAGSRLGSIDGAVLNFCVVLYGQVLSAVDWSRVVHGNCDLLTTMLIVIRVHPLPLPQDLIAACESINSQPNWWQLSAEDWSRAVGRFSALPDAQSASESGPQLASERYRVAINIARAAANLALPQSETAAALSIAVLGAWMQRIEAYIVYRYEEVVTQSSSSVQAETELVTVSAEIAALVKELLAADRGASGPAQRYACQTLELLLQWHSSVRNAQARQRLRAVVADVVVLHSQLHTALLFLRHVLRASSAAGASSWDDCSFLAEACIAQHLASADGASWLDVVETVRASLSTGETDELARTGLLQVAVSEKRGLLVHAFNTLQETIDAEILAASGGEAQWFDEKEAKRAEQQQRGEKDQALAPGEQHLCMPVVVQGEGGGVARADSYA